MIRQRECSGPPRAALAVLLLALGVSFGTGGCSVRGIGAAGSERSEVVFFDDFSGPALDRSRWNVEVTGQWVNDEQQAYIDSDEVIHLVRGSAALGASDGALAIEARPRPGFVTAEGRKFDFVSGRINTRGKAEFTSGTVAARIRLPAGEGLWPAFWALGTGRWPDTGEIDIMEYVGETDWVSAALHGPGYSGETPLVNKLFLDPGRGATEWHVYSVGWTPRGFVFRVDDQVMYRATRIMVEHYGRWAFDNPKYLILNLALGGAYPVKINGARTPYPGLPEPTVQLIRDGEARMLVDWVRVTRAVDE
jgi:beta-glucanase (GH16 family)